MTGRAAAVPLSCLSAAHRGLPWCGMGYAPVASVRSSQVWRRLRERIRCVCVDGVRLEMADA
jgi:hypothetical protein